MNGFAITNPLLILLAFPGILFFIIGFLFWINFSNVLLKKANESPEISLFDGFKEIRSLFTSKSINANYTQAINWLILRSMALIMCYTLILSIILFPDSLEFNFIFFLLIFLVAAFFNFGYEYNTQSYQFTHSKALYEILAIIMLFCWSLILSEYNLFQIVQNPFSNFFGEQILQFILLIFLIIVIGQINSYLGWIKTSQILLTPNQISIQHLTESGVSSIETSFKWFSESLSQSIFSLTLTLLIGQSILYYFIGETSSNSIYIIGFIGIWFFLLILSTLVSLLFFRFQNILTNQFLFLGGTLVFLSLFYIILFNIRS